MHRKDRLAPLLYSALGGLVTGLVILSAVAIADQDPSTDGVPRLIPYRGTLEQDGQPYDGGISMIFRIHDETDTLVFEELQQVQVFQGRFSVLLGSTGEEAVLALSRAVADADSLFLSIALRQGDAAETLLANRQRFLPVPYAFWTTASTDFHVGNSLSVAGHAEAGTLGVSGQASVATLGVLEGATVGGDLGVGGELSAGGDIVSAGNLEMEGRFINFRARDGVGDGGNLAFHGGGDILVLNNDGDFRDMWIEGQYLTLVAPTLRFRTDDGHYLPAMSLTENTLWLNKDGGITQGVRVDGRLMVAGPLHSKGNEIVFAAQSGSGNAGEVAYRGDNDTLVINRGGGFAGGTQVDGRLAVGGSLVVANAERPGRVALSADADDDMLYVNEHWNFRDGVRVNGRFHSSASHMRDMLVWSSKAESYVTMAAWFNRHCRIYLGHQNLCEDDCPAPGANPVNWGWASGEECYACAQGDNDCDNVCLYDAPDEGGIAHNWVGLQFTGDVASEDKMFIGFKCVD